MIQAVRRRSSPLAPLAGFVVTLALLVASPGPGLAGGWVRTRDGWEREEALLVHRHIYEPSVHPLVVATLVSLTSLMALVAFSAPGKQAGDDD